MKSQQNGKPDSKPRVAKNRNIVAAQALARKAVELAQAGNVAALKLCLELLSPPRKDRLIGLKLPLMRGAKDVPKTLAAVLNAVVHGRLTPGEGQAMAAMVETYRKGLELTDIEERLQLLEKRAEYEKS